MTNAVKHALSAWGWVAGFSVAVGLGATPALADEAPWRAPARAAQQQNPLSISDEVLAAGKKLYERECLSCHGKQGRGDGPAAAYLDRSLANFADAKWMKMQTDGELFWKISEGRSPMPSFKRRLTEEERWQLVHYLRTLSAPKKSQ